MTETLIPDVPLEDEEAYRQAPAEILQTIATSTAASDRDRVLAAKSLLWHEHQRAKQEAVQSEQRELDSSDFSRAAMRLFKHADNEGRQAIKRALQNTIKAQEKEARRAARKAKADASG
jgi:hypothetical protein